MYHPTPLKSYGATHDGEGTGTVGDITMLLSQLVEASPGPKEHSQFTPAGTEQVEVHQRKQVSWNTMFKDLLQVDVPREEIDRKSNTELLCRWLQLKPIQHISWEQKSSVKNQESSEVQPSALPTLQGYTEWKLPNQQWKGGGSPLSPVFVRCYMVGANAHLSQ